MAVRRIETIIQHLRTIALRHDEAGMTDGQLLENFVSNHEAAAFEALVRRHGTMVWGVCHRLLRNLHDAEDAFQATFLVLARKAASVSPRERVGNWLYGVAHTTALRAKVAAAKQRVRERQVMDMPEPAPADTGLSEELQTLLDQELSRLPNKYRTAIVLCDLVGRTRRAVAQQLKIPEGTLSSRLTTGRRMLAKRLARHGLTLPGVAVATMLAQSAASACVPAGLVGTTVIAAIAVAAGKAVAAVASVQVAVLTQGVLRAMLLNKIIALIVVPLVVLGAVGFGGGLLERHSAAAQPGQAEKSPAKILANRQAAPPLNKADAAKKDGTGAGKQVLEKRAALAGVIEKVDLKNPSLAALSIGSDAGLAIGNKLHVFRLKPEPRYLGTIRIVNVTPQKSVGQLLHAVGVPNPPILRVGDQVVSDLTARDEGKQQPAKEPAAEQEDLLKAQQDRIVIEQQRLTQTVEENVGKARRTYPDDPEKALQLLRTTLLQIWDHPDLSDTLRENLVGRIIAGRRKLTNGE